MRLLETEVSEESSWQKSKGLENYAIPLLRERLARQFADSGQGRHGADTHKTVAMFMLYVHTVDDPVRQAAESVANRRKAITGALGFGLVPWRGKSAVPSSSAPFFLSLMQGLGS